VLGRRVQGRFPRRRLRGAAHRAPGPKPRVAFQLLAVPAISSGTGPLGPRVLPKGEGRENRGKKGRRQHRLSKPRLPARSWHPPAAAPGSRRANQPPNQQEFPAKDRGQSKDRAGAHLTSAARRPLPVARCAACMARRRYIQPRQAMRSAWGPRACRTETRCMLAREQNAR